VKGFLAVVANARSFSACSIKLLTLSPCSGNRDTPIRGLRTNVRLPIFTGSSSRLKRRFVTSSRSWGPWTDCKRTPIWPPLSDETVSESRRPPLNLIEIELKKAVRLGSPECISFLGVSKANRRTAIWGTLCLADRIACRARSSNSELLTADAAVLFIVWFLSKTSRKNSLRACAREVARPKIVDKYVHPSSRRSDTCASNGHASNRSALCETLSIRYLAHRKAVCLSDRTAANGKNGKGHGQKCQDS
jgi:hypothetical protein